MKKDKATPVAKRCAMNVHADLLKTVEGGGGVAKGVHAEKMDVQTA